MNNKRVRYVNSKKYTTGQIVYWMSRDQRVHNNWALLYAQELAIKNNAQLAVVFCLRSVFDNNTARNVMFMLAGLEEVANELAVKNIPFHFLIGEPQDKIPQFISEHKIGCLVTDFNPLRWYREWSNTIANNIDIPMSQVDAHNIVPVWIASPKQEFGAYTIRPKIHSLLPEFLEPYPILVPQDFPTKIERIDWSKIKGLIEIDAKVHVSTLYKPGEHAAQNTLHTFLNERLAFYNELRNDPNEHVQSLLSPYLHFGHLSSQAVALAVGEVRGHQAAKEAFLEELIVRKELSDNYCFYNPNYDNPKGFPQWALLTHEKHKADSREYLYTKDELEEAKTHDELWNSAQREMVYSGKMHGYMRMYWAKKIFEWTSSVEKAQEITISLNDRYFLDGRDSNGYTGIAWSMGGVHDRAWFERPIFGKIRYMNYNGAKSKFNIAAYIAYANSLKSNR